MSAIARWHNRLLDGLLTIKPRQVPWTVALRNTIGVVLPLAVAMALGKPGAGLGMATGALTVMFSDQPGTYALRFRRLLLASSGGALAALVGFTLGNEPIWILPLTGLWAFAAGMLVALGPAPTRVGLTSIIVLLITSSRADPGAALPAAALIFGGGLLQAVLAVALWPLDRNRPQRHMLADAFKSLATSLRAAPDEAAPPPESATINELQSALLGQTSQRSLAQERFCILVHEYDQLRLGLVTLDGAIIGLEASAAGPLQAWMNHVADVLDQAAAIIRHEAGHDSLQQPLQTMNHGLEDLRGHPGLPLAPAVWSQWLAQADKLARHVRVVARNCVSSEEAKVQVATQAMRHLPRILQPGRPLDTLRANLRWHSVAFRHALRSAIVVTAGFALVHALQLDHGYWLPMTAAIVLKPDFGATATYGILRMLGTLAGLFVASLLLQWFLVSPVLRLIALAAACFVFREMAPRHYGLGVAALSGMLVLLLALAGEPAMPLVEARATATVAGCLLGLAAYLAWPSWERSRVRVALAGMLRAWSDYLASLKLTDETAHSDARSAARAARSNAQASLERLRQEPRTGAGLLAAGEEFFITGNRLARAAIALDALLLDRPGLRTLPALSSLLDGLSEQARWLAERLDGESAPSPHKNRIHACVQQLRKQLADTGDESGLAVISERFETIAATLERIVEQLEVTE